MPLLDDDTEFAVKWSNLCDAHLEEGIHTPIIAYEYLNRFYVQEGNKRVSVLKYYEAVTVPGTVTRLIPARNDTLENKIYYEFLDFYKLSKVNNVRFSKLGGYAKLQTLVCKASGEAWTDDDRLNFSSLYTMFSQQFYALGGSALDLTPGDALLVYLSVYRYSDACQSTPAQVRENLSKLWDEIRILTEPHAVTLSLEPNSASEPLLSKLNIFSQKPSQLKVVFLHEYDAKTSAWVRGHEKGIEALKAEFGDRLVITNRENVSPEVDAEQILEEVAHDNADVVFTTSIRMRPACLKVAAQHPKTKILNCCLNTPHPLVRTYYPRTYEVNYLLGMLAGILSKTDRVGYVAACPVYGIPAAVNAFARGMRAVRPDGHVVLRWACVPVEGQPLDFSDRQDVEIFYARDNRGSEASGKAVNYWWGLQSDAERVDYYEELAGGTRQLLNIIEENLRKHELAIFPSGGLYAQGHVKMVPQGDTYTPKELMEMDWLGECVEGALPLYEDLDVKTRGLMEINGLGSLKGMPL